MNEHSEDASAGFAWGPGLTDVSGLCLACGDPLSGAPSEHYCLSCNLKINLAWLAPPGGS